MQTQTEQELEHIRGLVVIRDALRRRGATAMELRRCDETIRKARRRLAAVVKSGAFRAA
jgi:hypothetical protein